MFEHGQSLNGHILDNQFLIDNSFACVQRQEDDSYTLALLPQGQMLDTALRKISSPNQSPLITAQTVNLLNDYEKELLLRVCAAKRLRELFYIIFDSSHAVGTQKIQLCYPPDHAYDGSPEFLPPVELVIARHDPTHLLEDNPPYDIVSVTSRFTHDEEAGHYDPYAGLFNLSDDECIPETVAAVIVANGQPPALLDQFKTKFPALFYNPPAGRHRIDELLAIAIYGRRDGVAFNPGIVEWLIRNTPSNSWRQKVEGGHTIVNAICEHPELLNILLHYKPPQLGDLDFRIPIHQPVRKYTSADGVEHMEDFRGQGDFYGATAFGLSVFKGKIESAKKLFNAGATVDPTLTKTSKRGYTALQLACFGLSQDAPPFDMTEQDQTSHDQTPITTRRELLNFVLTKVASSETILRKDIRGHSALVILLNTYYRQMMNVATPAPTLNRFKEMLTLLLKNGAGIGVRLDDKFKPLLEKLSQDDHNSLLSFFYDATWSTGGLINPGCNILTVINESTKFGLHIFASHLLTHTPSVFNTHTERLIHKIDVHWKSWSEHDRVSLTSLLNSYYSEQYKGLTAIHKLVSKNPLEANTSSSTLFRRPNGKSAHNGAAASNGAAAAAAAATIDETSDDEKNHDPDYYPEQSSSAKRQRRLPSSAPSSKKF